MDRRKNIAGKIVLKEIEEIKKQLYNLDKESRIIKNYPKSLYDDKIYLFDWEIKGEKNDKN
jgi:hypothetical protein